MYAKGNIEIVHDVRQVRNSEPYPSFRRDYTRVVPTHAVVHEVALRSAFQGLDVVQMMAPFTGTTSCRRSCGNKGYANGSLIDGVFESGRG